MIARREGIEGEDRRDESGRGGRLPGGNVEEDNKLTRKTERYSFFLSI